MPCLRQISISASYRSGGRIAPVGLCGKLIVTSFVELTEMWHDHRYLEIGDVIKSERWSAERIVEFCGYFSKHVGVTPLQQLYKFI